MSGLVSAARMAASSWERRAASGRGARRGSGSEGSGNKGGGTGNGAVMDCQARFWDFRLDEGLV